MQAIRSILVVMDPQHPEGLALKRAKLIAGVTQSHLHLLVCDKKATTPTTSRSSRPHCRRKVSASASSRRGTKACTRPSSPCSRPRAVAWWSSSTYRTIYIVGNVPATSLISHSMRHSCFRQCPPEH